MVAPPPTTLTFYGHELDTSPRAFGLMRSSIDLADDVAALRQRLDGDGYLYLPGYLDRNAVMAARTAICEKLADLGVLDPDHPVGEAICGDATKLSSMQPLAEDNPRLEELLYRGRMVTFYEAVLGGSVRHFDYTWCRSVPPGSGTHPHCDAVYMGRGTPRLYTSWTPIGDVTLEDGGLIVMEKSHHLTRLRNHYCRNDVDAFCTNRRDREGNPKKQDPTFGLLTKNPVRLRETLGLRWLTQDFRAGDLVVFPIFTVHGGLDNHGRRVRLSTDSRYQLASEPADDRWVSIDGKPPREHGEAGRRDLIC